MYICAAFYKQMRVRELPVKNIVEVGSSGGANGEKEREGVGGSRERERCVRVGLV